VIIQTSFRNLAQKQFYYSTARNQVMSGGFNNGKTYIGCFKIFTLLQTFPNSRAVIARQKFTDLKKTTMQTFFKLVPSELIDSHNDQDGITVFKNGSVIYWMHLDHVDENTLRGLEINWVLVDQAEEIEEKVYDVLDARIGRWDGAIVPQSLLQKFPDWPMSPTGKYIIPSYFMLLSNPDTQFHFIYRKYHPESEDRHSNYFYCEGEWDRDLGSSESYDEAITRDPEWVDKYVRGRWGLSSAQIHVVAKESYLEYTPELLDRIRSRGSLCRVLDHGDSAPTCCLWFAALEGVYICYREYYSPGKLISYHRQSIYDLSRYRVEGQGWLDEQYSADYADPSIFHKASQKDGGFWSVADEYISSDIDAPPLVWLPADNNEYATRNRINELLQKSEAIRHPVSKESNSPAVYFIRASRDYPHGCREAIRQLGSQRKKLLGTIEGKSIYSDDRDGSIPDHAYDPIRYYVAMHNAQPRLEQRKPKRGTFAYYNMIQQMQKQPQQYHAGSAYGEN
jgi:hypothetical protein